MFLDLDRLAFPMRTVFTLSEELRKNPERISVAQALTMDDSRPFIGLKGSQGLFGSKEWWQSIEECRIPLRYESGKILRAYVGGQDHSDVSNTVDLATSDGRVVSIGIFTNDAKDVALFREGIWVETVYALDELKRQARDGAINYAEIPLEVAVSSQPIN